MAYRNAQIHMHENSHMHNAHTCTCMHTNLHTLHRECTHKHTHIHTLNMLAHTYTHICIHLCTFVHVKIYPRENTHMHTNIYIIMYTHVSKENTHMHVHTDMLNTHMYILCTCIHTDIQRYTHTCTHILSFCITIPMVHLIHFLIWVESRHRYLV